MKKFKHTFIFLIISLACFNCSEENATSPENKESLIVQDEILNPGEIVKIDDYPLFVMNYKGDYGFHNYLTAIEENKSRLIYQLKDDRKWGCTCFAAMADSSKIFGRNFDYYHHIALILYAHSPNAYASVSMADISYLGFNEKSNVEELLKSSSILNSPYCTVDGLNEKGVAVGLMMVPEMQPPYDPNKKNLACCDIIRLILDYAASTNEAVSLIQQYNFIDEKNPSHYLISDCSGTSAIVEFVNKEVKVIRNNEPFQVSTNFIITGSSAPQSTSCWRYNTAYTMLKNANGEINENKGMNILSSVSQNITMWSAVYNMKSFSLDISVDKNYNKIYSVKVRDK